jgi:hypothetical protein
MHRGVPRKLSGGSSSLRRARTKERDDITRDAARLTWSFRAGVGSSSRRKLESIVYRVGIQWVQVEYDS